MLCAPGCPNWVVLEVDRLNFGIFPPIHLKQCHCAIIAGHLKHFEFRTHNIFCLCYQANCRCWMELCCSYDRPLFVSSTVQVLKELVSPTKRHKLIVVTHLQFPINQLSALQATFTPLLGEIGRFSEELFITVTIFALVSVKIGPGRFAYN